MKTILFEKLNLSSLSVIIFFRIIGYKIYFVRISNLFQNKLFLNFLKKINIIWFDYGENNLGHAIHYQLYNYAKLSSIISNKYSDILWDKFYESNFLNKEYFKVCLEFNIKKEVFDAYELVLIKQFIQQSNTLVKVWMTHNLVNSEILNYFNYKNSNPITINLNIFFQTLFNLFILIKNVIKNIINNKKSYKKNIYSQNIGKKSKFISFFPHGIASKFFSYKDYIYSDDISNNFFHQNILHIEWSKKYILKNTLEYYKSKGIDFVIWNESSNIFAIINIFYKSLKNNFGSLFKTLFIDAFSFKLINKSLYQIYRADIFFKNNPNLKIVIAGNSDLFPPEISISCKKNNVKTISYEERIILSSWSNRIIFDYYFAAGPKSKNNLTNKNGEKLISNIKEGFLLKTKNINQIDSEKKQLNCMVVDYYSESSWYLNGRASNHHYKESKFFYEIVLKLSNLFPNINFFLKSKSFQWLKIEYFKQIVFLIKAKKNITILEDKKKWTPENTLNNCSFGFGVHSSILDEMFSTGKPIVIFNRNEYPSKVFDYGEPIIANDEREIINKFTLINANFANYNKNLDTYRKKLFFEKNFEKFQQDLSIISKSIK